MTKRERRALLEAARALRGWHLDGFGYDHVLYWEGVELLPYLEDMPAGPLSSWASIAESLAYDGTAVRR